MTPLVIGLLVVMYVNAGICTAIYERKYVFKAPLPIGFLIFIGIIWPMWVFTYIFGCEV